MIALHSKGEDFGGEVEEEEEDQEEKNPRNFIDKEREGGREGEIAKRPKAKNSVKKNNV